jgi:hypothetical protein
MIYSSWSLFERMNLSLHMHPPECHVRGPYGAGAWSVQETMLRSNLEVRGLACSGLCCAACIMLWGAAVLSSHRLAPQAANGWGRCAASCWAAADERMASRTNATWSGARDFAGLSRGYRGATRGRDLPCAQRQNGLNPASTEHTRPNSGYGFSPSKRVTTILSPKTDISTTLLESLAPLGLSSTRKCVQQRPHDNTSRSCKLRPLPFPCRRHSSPVVAAEARLSFSISSSACRPIFRSKIYYRPFFHPSCADAK